MARTKSAAWLLCAGASALSLATAAPCAQPTHIALVSSETRAQLGTNMVMRPEAQGAGHIIPAEIPPLPGGLAADWPESGIALVTARTPAAKAPASSAKMMAQTTGPVQPPSPSSPSAPVTASPVAPRLNPTGRDIILTVPMKQGATYLGDVPLTIGKDDTVSFPAARTLQLLGTVLSPGVLETLKRSIGEKQALTPADFAPAGIQVAYNPQVLELHFDIPAESMATRSLAVAPLDAKLVGTLNRPEDFSAYLNVRSSFDLIEQGGNTGFQNPTLLLDAAARLSNFVIESDGIWTPDSLGTKFQREGSRIVYDDIGDLIRFTGGDLKTTSRGFQSTPDMAGISLFRSYSVLNPQQIVRPRGDQNFTLERNSTVEVYVNGQQIRRLNLNPGTYNLRDFPFTQGANDIRLDIRDDAGRTLSYNFNVFIDQTQLAKGLSEFGLYAGFSSPLGAAGPVYSDHLVASGYYRRGFTNTLTAGANFQADNNIQMGGGEALLSTSIGTFGLSAALSHARGLADGSAVRATFQRLIQTGIGASADTLNIFFERRSANFTPVTTFIITNPYDYEAGAGYTHAFNSQFYGGFDARYSKGRNTNPDVHSYRLIGGWRANSATTLSAEVRYTDDVRGSLFSGFVSLTVRLGRYSSIRTEFDSRENTERASFQTLHGSGVNSYNITADVVHSNQGAEASFNANYFTNRAELGINQLGTFSDDFSVSQSQRTNFRLGTSIAIAGDTVSIGRPIYDSFAVFKPNQRLHGANVVVDPSPYGYIAETGALRTATIPSLSSYAERTVTVDVPNAPAGTDIGQGAFRVYPPYRSGYRFIVGSDYAVTVIGSMVDGDGEPLALISGSATELAHPDRPPVVIFTNRQGRFGATGLAPGRWRVKMDDARSTTYMIDVPEKTEGILKVDKIAPEKGPTP